jgi:hypothetical protein
MSREYTEDAALVDDLFAGAREKFERIVTQLRSEEAAQMDHAEVEAFLDEAGRGVLRQLLQSHFDLRALREEKKKWCQTLPLANRHRSRRVDRCPDRTDATTPVRATT